jgi:CNT family concentrative nucleoside transporter
MTRLFAVLGILIIFLIIWLLSEKKKQFPWRIVIWGLILQFSIAIFILNVPAGVTLFQWLGEQINTFLNHSLSSANFLFGNAIKPENNALFGFQFAIIVSVTIIFFSSVVSLLYHWGIMQRIVFGMAYIMQKTMGTTGVESLSASANIFIGQTEAPLLVKHYLPKVSRSELNSIMVVGFATIAGGVLAAFVQMGISATILVTASIISAPGGLMLSKVLIPPEKKNEKDKIKLKNFEVEKSGNAIVALTNGAGDGLKLALNIMAMVVAFISLIAVIDAGLGSFSGILSSWGIDFFPSSLKEFLGYIFQPFAYLVGIPAEEAKVFGSLFGTKLSINEFIAYADLAQMIKDGVISERTATLSTFALCGFANIGSIAIQIGGLSGMAPERKDEIASLGVKAMIVGAFANLLTTTIASLLI